jgi:hypothetical protein
MPQITAAGEQAMTTSTAASIEARTCPIMAANSLSVPTGESGMTTRATWLVTPRGRMASYSGCTMVLVAGAITPNF